LANPFGGTDECQPSRDGRTEVTVIGTVTLLTRLSMMAQ
jgi:hypothetical protein